MIRFICLLSTKVHGLCRQSKMPGEPQFVLGYIGVVATRAIIPDKPTVLVRMHWSPEGSRDALEHSQAVKLQLIQRLAT